MDQGRLPGLCARLYQTLLFVYPAGFRDEFGREMALTFAAFCRAALRRGGLPALAGVWLAALADLAGSAAQEWAREDVTEESEDDMARRPDGTTYVIWRTAGDGPAFGRRLAQVLAAQPAYADALVTGEPTPRVLTVVDSIALDADPAQTQDALALFEELCGVPRAGSGEPGADTDALLAQLRDAERRAGAAETAAGDQSTLTARLLARVYADPALFELVSSVDGDDDLASLLDVLALDARAGEVDEALALVSRLSTAPGAA